VTEGKGDREKQIHQEVKRTHVTTLSNKKQGGFQGRRFGKRKVDVRREKLIVGCRAEGKRVKQREKELVLEVGQGQRR